MNETQTCLDDIVQLICFGGASPAGVAAGATVKGAGITAPTGASAATPWQLD